MNNNEKEIGIGEKQGLKISKLAMPKIKECSRLLGQHVAGAGDC